jgi:molybdate/tungstate transport system ATP-binding protein
LGLKLENISKTWRGFKLQNISLTVEKGEYFIILGPTGAGKTLLLETVMGFQKPDTGRIRLNGTDITNLPPENRGIGYVSQNCTLFPHLNVRENVEFGLKMQGTPQPQRSKTAQATMESLEITALANRAPATLSGGEKQKTVIARVLAVKPTTILLDEPLTGLDPESSRELKVILKQIHKDGKTILHVTHNQVEGFSLGDRMAIIKAGQIAQVGKTRDVFAQPQSRFVAGFLGYENIFPIRKAEQQGEFYRVHVGEVTLRTLTKPPAGRFVVAIRPEDINVHLTGVENMALNVLGGTVVDFMDQGPHVAVTFEAGLQLVAVMTKSVFLESNLEVGQKAWLSFKPQAVRVIGGT